MLQEIFYWLFNMSISASVTGIFVMLIRSSKMILKRLAVLLWAIPFIRMTVPFGLNSRYSMMSLLSKITTKTIVVYQPTDGMSFSMTNSVMAADSYFPITYKVNTLERVFGTASVIWIIVFLAIILMLTVIYFTTLHEMKDAEHLKDNIYVSNKIISPALYGIVRPKIVLPESYKDKDVELVVLHEKMHIRRADNLWRVLALFIAAAHWFNPLCPVFLKKFFEDLELSCDECVLVKLGECRAKEYALSLLENGQSKTVFTCSFGGAKIRVRIENIMSFKKMTRLSLTVFTVLIVTIFCVLLTNAG